MNNAADLGVAGVEGRIELRIVHRVPDDPVDFFVLPRHQGVEREGLRLEHGFQPLSQADPTVPDEGIEDGSETPVPLVQVVVSETIETDQEDGVVELRWSIRWSTT